MGASLYCLLINVQYVQSVTSRTVLHVATQRTRPPLLLHPMAAPRARPTYRLVGLARFLLLEPCERLDDVQARFQGVGFLCLGGGGSWSRAEWVVRCARELEGAFSLAGVAGEELDWVHEGANFAGPGICWWVWRFGSADRLCGGLDFGFGDRWLCICGHRWCLWILLHDLLYICLISYQVMLESGG